MEPARLWAAVEFTAQNGSPEGLLTQAARQGLHLFDVRPLPGGFRARCAANRYGPLAALARGLHVRLRVRRRQGLFFRLRPWLRRAGLWAGLAVFTPLLLYSQQWVWALDAHSLTRGQAARAAAVLWDVGLVPGSPVTEEKLAAGEYALLAGGEYSWVSLNFAKGRLEVQAAPATPQPAIAAGTLQGLRARCSGIVTQVDLVSGTLLVAPGQQVEAGQGLIGTARQQRDGTLIFAPAAGRVEAQLEWQDSQQVPLQEQVVQLVGSPVSRFKLWGAGRQWALPGPGLPEQALQGTRHWQPEWFGLALPCCLEETWAYPQQTRLLTRTPEQALALARFRSLEALEAAFPDGEQVARQEQIAIADGSLEYTVLYTLVADICTQNSPDG